MDLQDGPLCRKRRTFLCELSDCDHGLHTLRNVNKLLLVIAERVNVRKRTPIMEWQIVQACSRLGLVLKLELGSSCAQMLIACVA